MTAIVRHLEELRSDTPTPVLELPPLEKSGGGAERRLAPRSQTRFRARFTVGGQQHGLLPGIDLSCGGMMCACDEPIWPGNIVEMEVLLPDSESPVPVRGRIVELVSQAGQIAMRVRFVALSQRVRRRLARWVSDNG